MITKTDINKIYWHSRRGMLELDALLVPFSQEVYAALEPADQATYQRLLECEDPDLFQWFMRQATPDDAALAAMVRKIIERVQPT
jgi:antitoxin CptB